MELQHKQYINGQWIEAVDQQQLPLINPATEELITSISFGNEKDAVLAIDAAETAFKTWSKTTPYYRAEFLKKAANYLRDNLDTITRDMVLESGKPLLE